MKRSRVTAQGTPMPEATLCFEHFTGEHLRRADQIADATGLSDAGRSWVDTTGNPAVHCGVCGG